MPLKGLEKGAGKEVRSAHISVLKINCSFGFVPRMASWQPCLLSAVNLVLCILSNQTSGQEGP